MADSKSFERNWWRQQLRITWQLPIVLACLLLVFLAIRNWNWLSSQSPRIMHFKGTHAEIGMQHGQVLKKEIHELFDRYIVKGLVQREGWALDRLIGIGRLYEKYVPTEYVEEMKGIALASGMSYENILVMNTFPDAVLGKHPRACSAFAIRTERGLLIGRNLDWTNFEIAHRYAMVMIFEATGSHRVLSIGWPGMVGVVTGMNDRGLVTTLNMAYSLDASTEATPFLIRLREILEKRTSLSEASQDLISMPRTFAANILVASGPENDAVVMELSGEQSAAVPMTEDMAVTTNYFQRLDIKGGVGGDRSAAIRHLLGLSGSHTTSSQGRKALSAVCFMGPSSGMVTNQSVLFWPRDLAAEVAIGKLPATSGRYFRVTFDQ